MKEFFLVVLFFFGIQTFAAAPITHVFLAEKWMEVNCMFDEEQKMAFIAGNLFPDIQYLGEISRENTHEKNVTLNDINASSSPFLAGTRLHSYVDEMREALVVECQIYSYVSDVAEGHMATLLKLVEDEILFDRIASLSLSTSFSNVFEEELTKGVSAKTVQKWHQFLILYFSLRPSQLLEKLVKSNQPFLNIPSQTIKLWSHILPQLAQKEELINYVEKLEEAFLNNFQNSNSPVFT
jgi:hypothetical protein